MPPILAPEKTLAKLFDEWDRAVAEAIAAKAEYERLCKLRDEASRRFEAARGL